MKSVAIVLAGGSGSRMQTDIPKQYMMLEGYPMIYYSLKTMEDSHVDEVILVTIPGEEDIVKTDIVDKYGLHKVTKIVSGGAERYDSVYAGLVACPDNTDIVVIHDGARPMVTTKMVDDSVACARDKKACVIAVPVKDTVKRCDSDSMQISDHIDRSELWAMQTPQTFDYQMCREAYQKLEDDQADKSDITDDTMVVEHYMGQRTTVLLGEYSNIKVTTPDDILIAEMYLNGRK